MDGRRKRGRPKTRLKYCILADGRENLDLGMIRDRITWRGHIINSDPALELDNKTDIT